MQTFQTESESALYLFMNASHRAIEAEYEKLAAALRADDRDGIHARWVALESRLLAHFEAEERFLLPAFAKSDRLEAVDLLREHGKFRERILELGIAVELHHIRVEMVEDLARALREHAAREESLLYRWAATQLEPKLATAARHYSDTVDNIARR